jgi:mycoredoxin
MVLRRQVRSQELITVYGADWCEDTRRTLRQLRRLHVPHEYLNIDENSGALARAMTLNGGRRRTPTVDLGVAGPALVEPSNDTLTGALVELAMLTRDDAYERMAVQNVGDIERALRATVGAAILGLGGLVPRGSRWPFSVVGLFVGMTGLLGWCPAYHYAGMTSIGGPGDRPDESERDEWVSPNARHPVPASAGQPQ